MDIIEAVNTKYTVVGSGRYRRTLEHDSLVLDTLRNTFYWNKHGFGGDVFSFLTKILGMEMNIAKFISTPVLNVEPPKEEFIKQDLHLKFWEFGKNKRDFWYKRGYTDNEIDLYKLGYFAGAYSIPYIMNSVLNAITFRKEDKTMFEVSGSRKSLFGYDQVIDDRENNIDDAVIIVESPLDVPLLRRFGYNAISYTYGANAWNSSWNGLFEDFNLVFIIPDNDEAGRNILRRITFFAAVVRWPKNTPKGFDVGKLYFNNKEKFKDNIDYLLRTAIPIYILQ